MNTKLKRISAFAVICAWSMAAGSLAAEPDDDQRERRSRQRLEKMRDQLELNDEQFEKIKAIRAKYQDRRQKMKIDIGQARSRLQALMQADRLDREKIRRALEASAKLRVELRMLRLDQRIEMESVLTPQQRQILREKIKARRMKKDKKRKREGAAATPETMQRDSIGNRAG